MIYLAASVGVDLEGMKPLALRLRFVLSAETQKSNLITLTMLLNNFTWASYP